jgi:hypothetical protein
VLYRLIFQKLLLCQKIGNNILYGDERITTGNKLVKLFSKYGVNKHVNKQSIRHYGMFSNNRIFNYQYKVESVKFLNFFIPFYTHYNYVGNKII